VITTWLCSLRHIQLLIIRYMLGPLPVVCWCLVGLVGKLLRVSNEIWIWLHLLPLSRSSSSLPLIHVEWYSLVSYARSSWSGLNQCLLPFHLPWTYLTMHVLLMLSRWTSGPLVRGWLFVLMLLEEQLLLFQDLHLISILHRCRSFCIRWWIGDHNDLFRTSVVFFIFSTLVFKVELLCLA